MTACVESVQIPPRFLESGVAEKLADMLADLGFEAVTQPGTKDKGKGHGKRKSSSAVLVWRQPYCLGLLHLDRGALKMVADRHAVGKASSVPSGAYDTIHPCRPRFARSKCALDA